VGYLLRRVLLLALTLWVALTVNFFLPRLVPGDPIGAMLAKYQGRLDPQAVNALKKAYGLEDQGNLFSQYVAYLAQLARGELGRSTSAFPSTVGEVVGKAAPWTVGLLGVTTVLSFLVGSALGLYSAWNRGGFLADALPPLALFFNSVPYFWFSLLLLYVLAFQLGWFPLGGGIEPFIEPLWGARWWGSLLQHAVLPATAILFTAAGGWLLTMRNSVISVMGEDYIAFAKAKGLSERRILNRYVLRNALLPSVTAFGMALGFVIAGSLLTEVVFSYPGLGYHLYQAVVSLDYPLMQGIFLLITVAVLVANFVVDALYVVLDPRVRDGSRAT
jgi:peptide/nickel transport system permease protein